MKKILLVVVIASFLLSGCFISRIFSRKEKVGCPTDGRNVGAEKLLSDEKAMKKSQKAKWRGGR
jgi:outer membrane murein-binding lipoprotein Lpp